MIRFEEALLSEQLYLINSHTKLTKSEEKIHFKNAKGHPLSPVYLCFDSSGTADTDALLDMVQKLAGALPFPDHPPLQLDFAGLTAPEKSIDNWPHQPKFILLHGIDSKTVGYRGDLTLLQPQNQQGSFWMACPSFEKMKHDQQLKTQYWKAVKQLVHQ